MLGRFKTGLLCLGLACIGTDYLTAITLYMHQPGVNVQFPT